MSIPLAPEFQKASVRRLSLLALQDSGLWTLEQAAHYMGVAKVTIRRWTDKGILQCVRVGTRKDRRFRKADCDACLLQFAALADSSATMMHDAI